ncbi:hypothetical protein F2Q70_00042265 [Brassica cretica]|uniref:Uncharacterized protein n=1 Tax=Brassica cretica TaxID=69181 RepID=A0A8S9KIS9_BRACR|nr:hypothetical protein F2Q70_00042265 [Brassica cretica]
MVQDRERTNVAQLAAAEKLGNLAASLEARLRIVSNERKSTLEQVSFLEAKVESSANKFSDDLRRATYDAKKALADSYLDVLVSLKEKWEKKKAATDCEARLTEEVKLVSEFDVIAVSDFSVGKLDLPQISEDLPDDFFAKIPSAADDVTKCSGGQFEDSEFGIEDFAALVGRVGRNRRLDQGLGFRSTVIVLRFAALVGGVGRNRRLDQGLGFRSTVIVLRDFSARILHVWVVLSDAGRRSSFIGVFQCADRYRDLEAYLPFGLAPDFVSCVGFGPHEIMSTLFFGAGGGELCDSCSLANFGHLVLSVEVRDFSAWILHVWVVLSDAGRRSSFIGVFQCADRYRDLEAYLPFGLAPDFVGCVGVWPPQNHVDSFLRSWEWGAR